MTHDGDNGEGRSACRRVHRTHFGESMDTTRNVRTAYVSTMTFLARTLEPLFLISHQIPAPYVHVK